MSANPSDSCLSGSHGIELAAPASEASGAITRRTGSIPRRRSRIAAISAAEMRVPPRFASLRSGSPNDAGREGSQTSKRRRARRKPVPEQSVLGVRNQPDNHRRRRTERRLHVRALSVVGHAALPFLISELTPEVKVVLGRPTSATVTAGLVPGSPRPATGMRGRRDRGEVRHGPARFQRYAAHRDQPATSPPANASKDGARNGHDPERDLGQFSVRPVHLLQRRKQLIPSGRGSGSQGAAARPVGQ